MQPTSSPVKVGVIGIGNMGWHHARVLSLLKDANLIGVADPNEERGKLAIEQFHCEWFRDYKDLIPKVDAICIACLLYTSPSPRDRSLSRMPSSA